ncbi:MAG: CARDB domain-containing protein, partial [Chthoniobacteraceae bacterium]|nr:CARDB domain-containing protein [Chthoniobacteraceae bacterium]
MDAWTTDPLLPVEHLALLGAALLIFSAFASWRSSALCGNRLRAFLTALRLLGIACLLLVAVNPGRWEPATQVQDAEWALLVDRSASMATADVNSRSRWDEAVRLARKAAGLSTAPVRIHLFSGDLESGVTPARLGDFRPDGKTTDIAGAGRALFGQTARQRLNGLLFLSDGGQNGETPAAAVAIRALAAGSPIYALPVGGAIGRKDLSVSVGSGLPVGFAGQPLKLKAAVQNEGLGNITPVVELLDAAGKKLAEQPVALATGDKTTVTFEVVPESAGFTEYRVRVAPWPGEQIEANNEARLDVNVLGGKIRLFLAEGVPYWDSKFLVQLLRGQPNLEVTSVYRLASERFFKLETDVSKASNASEATFP